MREFLHVHLRDRFDVELTVYERHALRERPRSSTDGKPIVRVKADALEAMLRAEHAEAWERFAETGELEGIDDDEEDEGVHDLGSWDGLLMEEPPEIESFPTEDELAGDDGDYDPLPGFEAV